MYAGKERRNRVIALAVAVLLLASVVLSLVATVASAAPARAAAPAFAPAHVRLVSVWPADQSRLDQPPTELVLTFENTVRADLSQVILTRDGSPVKVAPLTFGDTTVTAAITGPMQAGGYQVAWRVTGDDGHPVSGESTFTVLAGAFATSAGTPAAATAPTPAAGAPNATPTYKTPQTQPTSIGHPDHTPGLVVGGALLVAGVILLVYEQRRRRSPAEQPIS